LLERARGELGEAIGSPEARPTQRRNGKG
jgi:hypothetical protein